MHTIRRIILLALVLTVMIPTTALAGGPGKWTRVTGEDAWFELNLLRFGDLHVSVQERQASGNFRLIHRSIDREGNVGPLHTVAKDFEYLGYYPGIVPYIGADGFAGLRILFGSKATDDEFPNATMRYVDSADGGETWSAPVQTGVTGGSGQDPSAIDAVRDYSSSSGISYQVWQGTLCVCVQRGLGPQTGHTNYNDRGGNHLGPSIDRDAGTHKIWVSWLVFGDDADGIYVREVDKATGEPAGSSILVPGSFDTYNGDRVINFQNGRVPMATHTRISGDKGVHVAYRKGYPSANRVNVWRIGASEPVTVARTSKPVGEVALTPAHNASKLWVLWVSDGKVFARRSDLQVKRWGKTVNVKVPADAVDITTLQADGDVSQIDILAHASKVTGSGFFHAQLLPGITFKASPMKFRGKSRVVFTTKDAGAPLSKSKVTAGGKSCTTNEDGHCSIVLGPYSSNKSLKARATRRGYAASSLILRVVT